VSFTIDLRKFAEKTGANIDTVRRKVALDIFGNIIKKTPVDTGRAKGSWVSSINSPSSSVLNTVDKNGSVALNNAAQTVSAWDGDDTIWIVNNLPYIRRLEYGWSLQAPVGMLRLSVREYKAFIEKAARSVK